MGFWGRKGHALALEKSGHAKRALQVLPYQESAPFNAFYRLTVLLAKLTSSPRMNPGESPSSRMRVPASLETALPDTIQVWSYVSSTGRHRKPCGIDTEPFS